MMTREEAIKLFEKQLTAAQAVLDSGFGSNQGENSILYRRRKEMAEISLTALRPVSREPLEKFKEYFDDLYGKGLEVYGWHMNGEAKSFDDFYEDACEYAGL